MDCLTLIVSFVLAISFLLAPCSSYQLNLRKPLQQVDHHHPIMFSQPSLPRKLNLNHETAAVKTSSSSTEEHFTPLDKFRQRSSGTTTKQHGKEENVKNAEEKGTWKSERVQEDEDEEETPNKSQYFTMDYGWVRKRRPIHNKQIPFLP